MDLLIHKLVLHLQKDSFDWLTELSCSIGIRLEGDALNKLVGAFLHLLSVWFGLIQIRRAVTSYSNSFRFVCIILIWAELIGLVIPMTTLHHSR